jgi:hypothetical protein
MRGLSPQEYEFMRLVLTPVPSRVATADEDELVRQLVGIGRITLQPSWLLGYKLVAVTTAGREAMRLHEAACVRGAI